MSADDTALTILKQEHHKTDELFEQLLASDDHAEQRQLRDELVAALSVHAGIEELVFYPAIRERLEERAPDVLEALEEHHLVKLGLWELERTDPAAERFVAKVTVLAESVRHHVQEEETVLFPAVREAFDATELRSIGHSLEQARATAPTRPHPLAPDTPPLNLLTLPIAAVDRAVQIGKETVTRILRHAG